MANSIDMNVTVRDGITACTIKNGVEIICKIPRKSLAKCVDIDELKHGGIYLLIGERDGRQMIYVGHSVGGLFDKLREHDRDTDKNFWTEALVFTTADNSFGARELVWLEDKFFDDLKSAGNFVVKIGDDESLDKFEAHAERARLVLSAIGCKIFEPLPAVQDDEEIFYLKRYVKRYKREVHAQMKRTPTGYRVLAGSEICPHDAKYLPNSSKKRRHFAKVDANGILLEDVELTSPSTAAEFILGNNANGLTEWKSRDGVTFGQIFYSRG